CSSLCSVSPLSGPSRLLPSCPTRRSSDLAVGAVGADTAEAEVLDEPVVQRPVDLELERAQRVRDPFVRIALTVRPVVHRVDAPVDRKSTRLNSSHVKISYAVFCLKKKKNA